MRETIYTYFAKEKLGFYEDIKWLIQGPTSIGNWDSQSFALLNFIFISLPCCTLWCLFCVLRPIFALVGSGDGNRHV